MFSGLDKENPYLDDKPNYERDAQTGKYIITNNFKRPNKIMTVHTTLFYQECGAKNMLKIT